MRPRLGSGPALGRDDRLEAFAAHPRIGERGGARASAWSRDEQSVSSQSAAEILKSLDDANRDYEQRFGHVFVISATGLGADEILRTLKSRIDNDPDTELEIAAAEQAKISDLRLAKLVTP